MCILKEIERKKKNSVEIVKQFHEIQQRFDYSHQASIGSEGRIEATNVWSSDAVKR